MPGSNGGAYGEELTLTSRYTNPATYGCQTWSAIVFSTPVADTERDGLIDALEVQPSGFSAYKDPTGTDYPRLWAMGANTGQKDLFVEVNSMATTVPTATALRRTSSRSLVRTPTVTASSTTPWATITGRCRPL